MCVSLTLSTHLCLVVTVHVAAQPSSHCQLSINCLPSVTCPLIIAFSWSLEPLCSYSSFLFFSFLFLLLEQGEMLFFFLSWSPEQLRAHRSDQFTFPLPAEKQCCLFSVGCLNKPSPPLPLPSLCTTHALHCPWGTERGSAGPIHINCVIISMGASGCPQVLNLYWTELMRAGVSLKKMKTKLQAGDYVYCGMQTQGEG